MIGTPAVDGWAVTFGRPTCDEGPGRAAVFYPGTFGGGEFPPTSNSPQELEARSVTM